MFLQNIQKGFTDYIFQAYKMKVLNLSLIVFYAR